MKPNTMPAKPRAASLAVALLCTLATARTTAQDLTVLRREHVDVQVLDRPGAEPRLGIGLRNGDNGVLLDPTQAILEVGASGRLEVPPGLEVFGPAGSSIWVLPQSQDPTLLYVGLSASGIPPGTWEPRFDLQLLKVVGPGHFFAWQFDPFSGLDMRMNSRDGIGPSDTLSPWLGGHEHVNWGFTATGLHEVHLRLSGRLQGTTNNVANDAVVLRFGVVPYSLPAQPASLAVLAWDESKVTCRISGSPSSAYHVERSSDLSTWILATTVTTDANGIATVERPSSAPSEFLRARAAP
jgi:surface-anchored protein